MTYPKQQLLSELDVFLQSNLWNRWMKPVLELEARRLQLELAEPDEAKHTPTKDAGLRQSLVKVVWLANLPATTAKKLRADLAREEDTE